MRSLNFLLFFQIVTLRTDTHAQMQAVANEVTKQKETQKKSNQYLLNTYISTFFDAKQLERL